MELLDIKATSPSSSIYPTSCNEVMRVVASEFFFVATIIFFTPAPTTPQLTHLR